jgi:hypothetical protein
LFRAKDFGPYPAKWWTRWLLLRAWRPLAFQDCEHRGET